MNIRLRPLTLLGVGLVLTVTLGVITLPASATIIPGPYVRPRSSVPVQWGVFTPGGPLAADELDAFTARVGKAPSLVLYYQDWTRQGFDPALAQAVVDRGATPLLTWEPWDSDGGAIQPAYALRTIIEGDHDAAVRQFARGVAAWGGPLLLRFGHEMNGNWYPWSEGVNGNSAGEFARAWRRLHRLFAAEGADNVQWVWSPNVAYPGSVPLQQLYPGESYVDFVALDAYNGGTALPWGGWQQFEDLISPTLDELRTISSRPVLIGETASTEAGGDKAEWIHGMFDTLEAHPEIVGFLWFNTDKETDWRVTSSGAAADAFSSRIAATRYRSGGS